MIKNGRLWIAERNKNEAFKKLANSFVSLFLSRLCVFFFELKTHCIYSLFRFYFLTSSVGTTHSVHFNS
jgi:hypothetical protein